MDLTRWRIVFAGEIAAGSGQSEVRANLQQLCRFSDDRLERLFKGGRHVLKNDLDTATAKRYLQALERTGALCRMEQMPEPEAIDLLIARPGATGGESPAASVEAAGFACPKCGLAQDEGLSCLGCGVVFAKLRSREEPATAGSGLPSVSTAEGEPEAEGYFHQHPEQLFLLKALGMIVAIILLRGFLSGGLLLMVFLLFPVVFLMLIRLHAATSGQNPSEVLAQHLTFMPVMYAEGERNREGRTLATYGLIALNILVFYGIEIRLDPQWVVNNLLFLPHEPNAWNVPFSLLSSMFLHAGNGHLWGNMTFLWAVGTVVERRIGSLSFLGLYLVTGAFANLFALVTHRLLFGDTLHALGASGAIAGVMGIFAVRCYFKSMVFPLPILGIFSLILPVSLKVRLNSLVIIGLFFLADLSGGIAQAAGTSQSNIGHWIHVGGMLGGIALAMLLKLGSQAIDERHLDIGAQALEGGKVNHAQGEESLRLALQRNPGNTEAQLMLARLRTRFGPDAEAEQLYRQALKTLVTARPEEALVVYCEFFNLYMHGVDADTQYRLSALFARAQDFDMASRCLEPLLQDQGLAPTLREKVVFQYARILDQLGLRDQARHYYHLLVESFPDSEFLTRARARLGTV